MMVSAGGVLLVRVPGWQLLVTIYTAEVGDMWVRQYPLMDVAAEELIDKAAIVLEGLGVTVQIN